MTEKKPTYEDLEQKIKALEQEAALRKKVEGEARVFSEKYEKIFQAVPNLMAVTNVEDGAYLEVNDYFIEATGYTREEIIGNTSFGLEITGDAGYREKMRRELEEKGKFRNIEVAIRLSDGKNHDGLLSGEIFDIDGQQRFLTVWVDITERKKAEEERINMERQIQQAQKLESLGILAGGIAHDFNNLLTGVLGSADLALLSMTPESPGVENIHSIQTAAERAAGLARQMLAYSGKGHFVIKRMELQFLAEEMIHLLEASIPKKAVIRCDFAQGVPPVEADPTQIRQIIMNLVINASEAIGDRNGVISIRTGSMECDTAYLDETYLENDLKEGVYSYFEVTDTGQGMDKETIDKIFDPFFTTKFTGRGLGLAAVLGIVRGHKGAIKVESEPGKGTTFKALFPAKEGSIAPLDRHSGLDLDTRLKGKTVLLVDDEDMVRAVGKDILKALSMEVFTAKDGREALQIFKEAPDKFDYIILDLTMPYLDGEETFREMSRIKKDICVILASGYSEHDLITRFAGKGFCGFIQKPYRVQRLKEILLVAKIDRTSN